MVATKVGETITVRWLMESNTIQSEIHPCLSSSKNPLLALLAHPVHLWRRGDKKQLIKSNTTKIRETDFILETRKLMHYTRFTHVLFWRHSSREISPVREKTSPFLATSVGIRKEADTWKWSADFFNHYISIQHTYF